ncbi:alpha/beta fold hydrolase [Geodermatophilus sp. SYSU D01036]
MTYETVRSADGTPVAYEVWGSGPPLVTVCGATCDRALMRPTARALGEHATAVAYDRRGRGDSGDTLPYAVEREVEDLAALVDAVGGRASLYGHSSGAALALRAVAAGLPVDRFVLHDPPFAPDDPALRDESRTFAAGILDLLAAGERDEAVDRWCRGTGMPGEVVDAVRSTPRWAELVALAPTLAYEIAVLDSVETGGAVPEDVARRAARPGLVLVGGDSPPFMQEVARRVAELLPAGALRVLPGSGHVVAPEVLAPLVAEFLRG